jgi:hypothetical protein
MKNSNDTIGNRSRVLPVCSAVPQPMRHRVPPINCKYCNKIFKELEVGVELVKAMGTFSDDSK